jgi:endonuclease III
VSAQAPSEVKEPFDIEVVLARIRESIKAYPKAAMFQLFEDGHRTVFEQVVACILSIRTLDEVSIESARRLFSRARTPAEMARLSVREIDGLIGACTASRAASPPSAWTSTFTGSSTGGATSGRTRRKRRCEP